MDEKKIVVGEKTAELSDEQLDNVVGGLFIQTGSFTCAKCGKTFSNSAEREKHEKTCKG